ncbi:glycerophosphodiester phosphodiesterase family protein [Parvicella tangerina]|uniref:Glycerophosphodiester phosphodiesterase n=1 Tax=Parvicella tangerina TaxID=2829795 RepID=A0A916NFX9_9FLAO|nr:glycerophosphodiester phosphodiesterase family protein [Parvicella tangerina]CAG5078875.1 Glycerophosphodiester phosphodiesterase [Parvicella tangerina]
MIKALILPHFIIVVMTAPAQSKEVQIFGHRGCRGLYPENSLEGFKHAIDLGVDGIEWDVVVSGDKQLIISHEPYVHGDYCLGKNGESITTSDGKNINFYELKTSEIQQFDCGSKNYPKYPDQQKVKTYKPTVQETFKQLPLKGTTILFEIKSETADYGKYQPQPKEYAEIIVDEIANFEYRENIVFMSFDPNLLEALHKLLPDFRYVYLTYKPFTSVKHFLKDISFVPFALGMYHATISKRDIKLLADEGVKTFAWTVNKEKQAQRLKRAGVDGIITDYPNLIK